MMWKKLETIHEIKISLQNEDPEFLDNLAESVGGRLGAAIRRNRDYINSEVGDGEELGVMTSHIDADHQQGPFPYADYSDDYSP